MLEDNKKLEYRKRIGQGLAVAREELNLTQIEVGKTGIVRSNRLSQIELGKVSITTEELHWKLFILTVQRLKQMQTDTHLYGEEHSTTILSVCLIQLILFIQDTTIFWK